ncbi:MAG TPA: hypothetical protein VK447_16325, partial [Myxococcaceae bacterium]|nr:hypothetical protein [Myxococcaceae bacterium]
MTLSVRALPPCLAVLALLCAGPSRAAESVAVAFADPSGFNEANQLKLLRASEQLLRERTSLNVLEQEKPRSGVPRRGCGEDPQCIRDLAATTRADYALLLTLGASSAGLAVDGVWVEVNGTRALQRKVKGVSLDAPQSQLRELLDGLVPAWARRGYGGLVVDVAPGARIKVDGRAVATTPLSEPLAIPAGAHELDVLLPSGHAQLQKVSVAQGARVRLRMEGNEMLAQTPGRGGVSGLRVAAYSTWSAGALTLAGAFITAGLAQASVNRIQACGADRQCSNIGDALAERERAQQAIGTANVLMVVGGGLMTAG